MLKYELQCFDIKIILFVGTAAIYIYSVCVCVCAECMDGHKAREENNVVWLVSQEQQLYIYELNI